MSDEKKVEGCVVTAKGPVKPVQAAASAIEPRKETKMTVMVGKEAPDFEASAYQGGGFKNVTLSDFRGKWVFLCFYPGDFTFV